MMEEGKSNKQINKTVRSINIHWIAAKQTTLQVISLKCQVKNTAPYTQPGDDFLRTLIKLPSSHQGLQESSYYVSLTYITWVQNIKSLAPPNS